MNALKIDGMRHLARSATKAMKIKFVCLLVLLCLLTASNVFMLIKATSTDRSNIDQAERQGERSLLLASTPPKSFQSLTLVPEGVSVIGVCLLVLTGVARKKQMSRSIPERVRR